MLMLGLSVQMAFQGNKKMHETDHLIMCMCETTLLQSRPCSLGKGFKLKPLGLGDLPSTFRAQRNDAQQLRKRPVIAHLLKGSASRGQISSVGLDFCLEHSDLDSGHNFSASKAALTSLSWLPVREIWRKFLT